MESQGYESDSTIVAEAGGADSDVLKKMPFPTVQLSIICLTQFAEPIASSVLYPFIIPLVWHTGITRGDEAKIGYYAGAIESAYFFAECLSVLQWSQLADRIGRRPVLLLGPLGVTLSIFSLGMSNNYWIIIASRCLQGVFNGTISGVGKSMIIEITDPSDVPKAFGWLPAVWCAGITLGPLVGGALSNAGTKWPDTFGKSAYVVDHPYFLPCAVVGSIAFLSYLYAWCFLRESIHLPSKPTTRESNRQRRLHKSDSTTPLLRSGETNVKTYGKAGSGASRPLQNDDNEKSSGGLRFLLIRPLLVPLINYAFTAFLDQSYLVLLPLMFSTSIAQGGLAFDPFTIGIIMGSWGVLNALFQVVAFTRVMRWLGPRRMYILSFSCFFFTFMGFPVMSFFAKRAGRVDLKVACVLVAQMICFSVVYMSYACSQLFLLDAAPRGVSVAGVTGLGQTVSTMVRGFAPMIASSLFSLSLQEDLGGGYLVYGTLMGTTLVGVFMASKAPPQFKMQE